MNIKSSNTIIILEALGTWKVQDDSLTVALISVSGEFAINVHFFMSYIAWPDKIFSTVAI